VKGLKIHHSDSWPDSGPFTKSIQSSLSTAHIRVISKFDESRGETAEVQEIDFSNIQDDRVPTTLLFIRVSSDCRTGSFLLQRSRDCSTILPD
jgi:hypothetical protein